MLAMPKPDEILIQIQDYLNYGDFEVVSSDSSSSESSSDVEFLQNSIGSLKLQECQDLFNKVMRYCLQQRPVKNEHFLAIADIFDVSKKVKFPTEPLIQYSKTI